MLEINKLLVNKPRESMKTNSICNNQCKKREKKHYTNKQHYIKQQTALSKQALYTTALK